MKKVLVLTISNDYHSYAVAEALKQKGAEVDLWHTSDFPSHSREALLFEGEKMSARFRAPGLDLIDPDITTVWHRRLQTVVNVEPLHQADRKFAEMESRVFRRAVLEILSEQGFWVNPWRSALRAECKPVQHRAATEVGLAMPDTLYSNDPDLVRSFLDKHRGRAVYKALQAIPWTDGDKIWMPYTSLVTVDDLPDDEILQNTPGIYQQVCEKAHELRVTIMGNRIFSAKLRSQETSQGRLDWRGSYHDLVMEPHELDPGIAAACLRFMERMGLVFGCIDFIVTPRGEHVFLEVNQMGQFLFVECSCGLPLLDAFSELLLQGRVDFNWSEEKVQVRYTDEMRKTVKAIAEQQRTQHVAPPRPVWTE